MITNLFRHQGAIHAKLLSVVVFFLTLLWHITLNAHATTETMKGGSRTTVAPVNQAYAFVDESLPEGDMLRQAVSYSKDNAFHLFSHGRPGELFINGQWLDAEAIASFVKAQFSLPNSQFSVLHIYGCEFAQGEAGRRAVANLEASLGITVAASTNITGKDGDWILETTGDAFAELSSYSHNLQVCGVDIHIANDNSGSVDATENRQSRAFVSQLGVSFAPLGTGPTQSRISISTWATGNNFVRYSFPAAGTNFTTSLSDVLSYANSARTLSGGTDVAKALLTAQTWVNTNPISGRGVPKVVVLMTDASCFQIASSIQTTANQLKSQGVYIVVMALDAATQCGTVLPNVASPGAYFAANEYVDIQNQAINYINNIRSTVCSIASPPPYDLTVSMSNFQITNCTPGPATASVNYTVTNLSSGTAFNNNLRIAFYNGNPTNPSTQHLFTVNAGTQAIAANGGTYSSSTNNAALVNTSTLYAVVNYDGALAGNAPPLSYSTLRSKLNVSGEGSANNNISAATSRTNGVGCIPYAQLDVRVSNTGVACDNEVTYTIKVCNTGTAAANVNPATYLTAYPPTVYTFVSSQLIGTSPFVGNSLPAGACATYAYTYNLNNAVPGTTYDFSAGVRQPACLGVTAPAGFGIVESSGKCWLDRNLGATQVATSSTDAAAYGHLYQWGRRTDGHQIRTSSTTTTLATTDQPTHGDFIITSPSPFDWRSNNNDNRWNASPQVNNPCPTGYRVPTESELNTERLSWVTNNAAGAFGSPLKLPVAGYRGRFNGDLYNVSSGGRYWFSTVSGTVVSYLGFDSSVAGVYTLGRADGCSVRCLKD